MAEYEVLPMVSGNLKRLDAMIAKEKAKERRLLNGRGSDYHTFPRRSSQLSQGTNASYTTIGGESIREGWVSTPMVLRFVSIMSSFIEGYDVALMAATVVHIRESFRLSNGQLGLLMGLPNVFAFFVPLLAGVLADKFGRKTILMSALPLASLALTCMAFAYDFKTYALGRVIAKLGSDAGCTVTALYINETAPAGRRGTFACMEEVLFYFGGLCAWMITFVLGGYSEPWRIACMMGAVGPVLFTCILAHPMVPESPRFLHRSGQVDEARKVLEEVTQGNEAEMELTLLTWDEADRSPKRDLYTCLKSRQMQIVIGVFVFIAVAGGGACSNCILLILEKRVATDQARKWATLIQFVKVLASIPSIWLLDTIGRRPLILIGTGMMIPASACIALGLTAPTVPVETVLGGTLIFFACFTLGPGTAGRVYGVEIVPLEAPGFALGVAKVFPHAWSVMLMLLMPTVLHFSASLALSAFAVTNTVGFLFFYNYCPETKGRILEELQEMLDPPSNGSRRSSIEDARRRSSLGHQP
jgi:MFS family permease